MTRKRLAKAWWWAVDWSRFLLGRETRDQAWSDGYRQSEEDGEEDLLRKDAWIAQCEWAINEMMSKMPDVVYSELDPEVQDFLRNFV